MRRILGMKKIGHTGTLDPMATGVLPICMGSATRITEYLDLDFKKYRGVLRLGLVTDTQDIWGTVIEERPTMGLTEEQIRQAFSGFYGEIDQKPPMYSAVRLGGKRLYEYARAGQQVEVKSRKIYIRSLTVEAVDMDAMEVTFTVECSKGTYIRTICQDVGQILGTGATMTGLVRLSSGRFTLEEAFTLEQVADLAAQDRIHEILLPPDYPLVYFGKALLSAEMGKKFVDGWHIPLRECKIQAKPYFAQHEAEIPIRPEYRRAWCLYQEGEGNPEGKETPADGFFLGVAFYDEKYKKLVADKVFFRGQEDENF
jgi:tRNA pseudouridine55 synthase